jgi:Flp pilus assembly protein TadD
MSLLLQALQKASKNREGAEGGDTTESAGDRSLALEPLSEPELRDEDLTAHGGPTPAQAAKVLRASEQPSYSAVDWVRDRPMLVLISAAVLFAIGYGTYVYFQIANPGMFRTPPPGTSPVHAVAPAPEPEPLAAAEAKVSGMPSIDPAGASGDAGATGTVTAATAPPRAESATPAPPRTETPAPRPPRAQAPARTASTAPAATPSQPPAAAPPKPTTAAAANAVETIEIGAATNAVALVSPETSRGESIAVRRQAGGLLPVDPTLMAAYEALEAGDYPRAKMLYSEVIRTEPRNVDALLGLGAIALKERRSDDAGHYFSRVLQAEPRNAHAQAGLITLVGGADPLAAESRLKLLLAREPSAYVYFTLGNLYAEQGQWPAAQQAYFQAAQLQPDNPDYAFNLAVGLEHLGQPRLALDYYRKALDLSFRRGRANFDQNLAIQRVGQLSARVE